jgi:hypothetical protein
MGVVGVGRDRAVDAGAGTIGDRPAFVRSDREDAGRDERVRGDRVDRLGAAAIVCPGQVKRVQTSTARLLTNGYVSATTWLHGPGSVDPWRRESSARLKWRSPGGASS